MQTDTGIHREGKACTNKDKAVLLRVQAKGKPSWLPVPGFAVESLLAEGAQTVLNGQRVLPKKALDEGYEFKHPRIQGALKSML